MASGGESVTLHSSWRGLVGGGAGAVVLAAAGTYGVAAVGFEPIPGALLVVGWALFVGFLLDYPVASRFTVTGVQRRMLLRRQHLAWRPESRLTRTRPSLSSLIQVDRELRHAGGALSLKQGRRRYLLVDQVENGAEYDELVRLLEPVEEWVRLSGLPRPPDRLAPTWMYRRRRWRPDSGDVR